MGSAKLGALPLGFASPRDILGPKKKEAGFIRRPSALLERRRERQGRLLRRG